LPYLQAQVPVNEGGKQPPSAQVRTDTGGVTAPIDTLSGDTLLPRPVKTREISFSKDSLDAPVQYSAVDSMIYDIGNQRVHLYGEAEVSYTSINLKAAHIIFDWQTNIVTASGMPDSLGQPAGLPEFSDASQTFTADSMRYNFAAKKGVVYDVVTMQNDIVVRGTKSKFITREAQDSTEEDQNIVYSSDAIFTTCTHEEPHFGIRSRKQKVIPNKLVVVGPSNLEIMNVPTPVWLPFGFFPIPQGRSTGLLFPRDYQYLRATYTSRGPGVSMPFQITINATSTTAISILGMTSEEVKTSKETSPAQNPSFFSGVISRLSQLTPRLILGVLSISRVIIISSGFLMISGYWKTSFGLTLTSVKPGGTSRSTSQLPLTIIRILTPEM
jgi:hypothetical protein